MVILFAACGGTTLDVGSQGGGGEGGVDGRGGVDGTGGVIRTKGGSTGWGGSASDGSPPIFTSGGSPMGNVGVGAASARGGTPGFAGTTWSIVGGVAGESSVLQFAPIVPARCGEDDLQVQVWEGFTQGVSLHPAQKWRLNLTLAGDGSLCGSATYVVEGQMPPGIATDPDAVYPPDITATEWNQPSVGSWPGVTYSSVGGYQRNGSWKIDLAASELWSEWCRIQHPYPAGNGYSCLPEEMFVKDGQYYYVDPMLKEHAFSPMKEHLCGGEICACTSKSCSIASAFPIVFSLIQKNDRELTGALLDGQFSVGITLTRGTVL